MGVGCLAHFCVRNTAQIERCARQVYLLQAFVRPARADEGNYKPDPLPGGRAFFRRVDAPWLRTSMRPSRPGIVACGKHAPHGHRTSFLCTTTPKTWLNFSPFVTSATQIVADLFCLIISGKRLRSPQRSLPGSSDRLRRARFRRGGQSETRNFRRIHVVTARSHLLFAVGVDGRCAKW